MPFHPTVLSVLDLISEKEAPEAKSAPRTASSTIEKLNHLVPHHLRCRPALALPPPSSILTNPSLPLLLGRIQSRRDGSLVITHTKNKYSSILFAPPLPLQYRSAIVYCQDYRYNGLIIQVLACHVHILLPAQASVLPSTLRFISILDNPSPHTNTAMKGRVFSKSPIFGRNHHMAFVLELSLPNSPSTQIVSVLFQGTQALKWWPFLQLHSLLAFIHLKRAKISRYPNRLVLKGTDQTQVFSIPCDSNFPRPQNQPPPTLSSRNSDEPASPLRKRPRVSEHLNEIMRPQAEPGLKPMKLPPFFCTDHTITYEGVISQCLNDGRLILDDSVYLHLGGDVSWLSSGTKGSSSVRKGAKIQAFFVSIGYQRGIPTTLFPTGRTTINFLYFGQNGDSNSSTGKDWNKSPWFRYWKYLSKHHALWVQELYDTLPIKFAMWTDNQVQLLLGDAEQINNEQGGGLLEFLIEKVAGVKLKYDKPPQDYYDDFFGAVDANGGDDDGKRGNSFPYMPTIAELKNAINIKWKSSRSALFTAVDKSGRVFVEQFGRKEIANAINPTSRKSPSPRRRPGAGVVEAGKLEDVIIVGLLEGCPTIDASFVLTDSTDQIYCECIGNTLLDPIYLGAVVIVHEFTIVAESTSGDNRNTLLFNAKSIQILIDGPFHDTNFIDIDSTSPTPSGYTQSQYTQDDDFFPNLPLAFILIHQVSRITWKNNSPEFRLTGKILGAVHDRYSLDWVKFSSPGDGEKFIDCFMVINGKNSVLIRNCLQEGTVFAISCSDFKDVPDIRELCAEREKKSVTIPPSIALYSTGDLWIKKLNADDVGRFSVNPSKLLGLQFRDLLQVLKPENGENGSPLSLSGIFLYGERIRDDSEFKESENGWRSINYRIIMLDKQSALFRSEILFFHNSPSPRALIPGKSIRIVNVKRRLSKNRRDGTDLVLFTACEMTKIYMDDESPENSSISLCCHRPYPPIEECCKPLSLWNFVSGKRNEHLKGLIRVNILEVMSIDFSLLPMNDCCDTCRFHDGKCIAATAYVRVEDGTTQGEIQVNSFPKVMQLLDGSEDDFEEFRKKLPDEATWRRLARRITCKSIRILVRNKFIGDQSSLVQEATLHGYTLGYGRKLWTAEAPKLHMARLEALAIYPEDDWEQFSYMDNVRIAE